MIEQWSRAPYTISTDPKRLDVEVIEEFLARSYWAEGRSRERIVQSIERSIPFGLYHHEAQVGFARVVTDGVVIAYLADVFVLETHRGRGLGLWLCQVPTSSAAVGRVRRWLLGTRDAHGLYRRLGFRDPQPGLFLERVDRESDRVATPGVR